MKSNEIENDQKLGNHLKPFVLNFAENGSKETKISAEKVFSPASEGLIYPFQTSEHTTGIGNNEKTDDYA